MAVVTKVKSRVVLPAQTKVESRPQERSGSSYSSSSHRDRTDNEAPGDLKAIVAKKKKYCAFCQSKGEPHYWDSMALRRFVNDRGRIVARARTGTCSKHQRRVSREIKHARHLALLPFIVRV